MVHTFPKGICPKVNVVVRLEFELMYYDSAVQHFNHYTPGTIPLAQEFQCLIISILIVQGAADILPPPTF